MREETVKIYEFSELKEDVQKKVIERYMNMESFCWSDHDSQELRIIFGEKLEDRGYPVDDIEFSLCHCQGDGVAFYGDMDITKWLDFHADELKDEMTNKEIKRIRFLVDKDELDIKISRTGMGHYYSHQNTMRLDVEDVFISLYSNEDLLLGAIDKLEKVMTEKMKEMSVKLEEYGYKQIDFQYGEDYIKDVFVNNDYEFLENGDDW